jgi:hypothetical protein
VTPFEPIPESVEALDELDPSRDADDLLAHLRELANRAQDVLPDLVGVSVARFDHGLTFTLVVADDEVAVLDAIQYVAGGPCVDAAHDTQVRGSTTTTCWVRPGGRCSLRPRPRERSAAP